MCGQRAQDVDPDVRVVVEGEDDQRDEKRTDRWQQVSDGVDATAQHRKRADQQTQARRTHQAPRCWLQDQREAGALHRIAQDRDPGWKSPALIANWLQFRHTLLRADGSRGCTCHQLGERERLVVAHIEIRVGDVYCLAGRAADPDVVRQRQELVVEPVGA